MVKEMLSALLVPEILLVQSIPIATLLLSTVLATDLGLPSPAWTGFVVSWILIFFGVILFDSFGSTGSRLVASEAKLTIGALFACALTLFLGLIAICFHTLRHRRAGLRYGAAFIVGLLAFWSSTLAFGYTACALNLCGDDGVVGIERRAAKSAT